MCVCAQLPSYVQLFATPWTITRQAALSMGILQPRIPEWVAISSSRGYSWPSHSTHISICIGRWVLYHWAAWEAMSTIQWICPSSNLNVVAAVLVAPSWVTLCNPMDCSLLGSSVHGIFQAIILERVVISSFSRGSSWPRVMNPFFLCLLHWQAGSLPLASPGKLKMLRYTGWSLWGQSLLIHSISRISIYSRQKTKDLISQICLSRRNSNQPIESRCSDQGLLSQLSHFSDFWQVNSLH